MSRVDVKIDLTRLAPIITNASNKAKFILCEQIVKDSNFYAPEDTTQLIRSAVQSSNFEEGKIVWNTPYARRLYYNPQFNFSTDKNRNAGGLWFESAKSKNDSWVKTAQKAVEENL